MKVVSKKKNYKATTIDILLMYIQQWQPQTSKVKVKSLILKKNLHFTITDFFL